MRFALLALIAWPLAAQDPQPISVGQSVTGELTADDRTLGDESYFDMWVLSAEPGTPVRILLMSAAFDTWLSAGLESDTGFVVLETNDDYEGTNSRLDITVPGSGTLYLRVNSFSAGEAGAYQMTVSLAPGAPVGGVRAIAAGTTSGATFVEDEAYSHGASPAHFWRFDAEAGVRYAITMTSTDVDSYLSVGRGDPESFESLEENDDVDGGTDSRVIYAAEASGPVTIRASLYAAATGAYRIAIQRLP